jgi:hypothetical protein
LVIVQVEDVAGGERGVQARGGVGGAESEGHGGPLIAGRSPRWWPHRFRSQS